MSPTPQEYAAQTACLTRIFIVAATIGVLGLWAAVTVPRVLEARQVQLAEGRV